MELNYAAIINAGQGLVGDLQEQMMMQDQRKQQQQARALQVQDAQIKQQRQVAFRDRLTQVAQGGRYNEIPQLMTEFPEFADQLKPGYDALSKDAKARNLTQMGTITRRATNGDVNGAVGLLKQRVEADKAAGQDTSEEEDAIRMLSSADPLERQAAISTLHMLTYNADPDGYKVLFPAQDPDPLEKKYNFILRTKGQQAADRFLAVENEKFIAGQPGGQIFRGSDLVGAPTQGGGDQSTGMGGVPAPALGDNGMPPALTPEQYQAIVDVKGKAATDAWAQRNGVTISAPTRVQSTKTVSGKTYYQIGGRWFDNAEGR